MTWVGQACGEPDSQCLGHSLMLLAPWSQYLYRLLYWEGKWGAQGSRIKCLWALGTKEPGSELPSGAPGMHILPVARAAPQREAPAPSFYIAGIFSCRKLTLPLLDQSGLKLAKLVELRLTQNSRAVLVPGIRSCSKERMPRSKTFPERLAPWSHPPFLGVHCDPQTGAPRGRPRILFPNALLHPSFSWTEVSHIHTWGNADGRGVLWVI